MSQRRVVVTGMGIVSPVGNTLATAWDSIRNGRSGIGRITHFDPSPFNTQIAGVAAVAGLLLAPITFVHANMGFIGLKAFPAAVVGGFGSLPGAIVGGLVIGIVESMAGFYLPEGVKDIAPYIVVLLMLVLKPNGLFGEKLRKKV